MFARRQPQQLRQRLAQVERDEKIKLLSPESCRQQKVEILTALKRLKDPLTPQEREFLERHSSQSLRDLEQVADHSLDQAILSSLSQAD